MLELFKFILINFGITVTIVRARPFKFIREWLTKKSKITGEFINCYQCIGLWVTPLSFLLVYKTITDELIAFVFIGTGTCQLLGKLANKN